MALCYTDTVCCTFPAGPGRAGRCILFRRSLNHGRNTGIFRYRAWTAPQSAGAYLYLPACYDAEPARRFPVLYMFDGHNVFFDSHATYGKSWGMAEYLDRTRTPLIVAAVECNHGPNNERSGRIHPLPFPQPALWEREGFRPRDDGMVCPQL